MLNNGSAVGRVTPVNLFSSVKSRPNSVNGAKDDVNEPALETAVNARAVPATAFAYVDASLNAVVP